MIQFLQVLDPFINNNPPIILVEIDANLLVYFCSIEIEFILLFANLVPVFDEYGSWMTVALRPRRASNGRVYVRAERYASGSDFVCGVGEVRVALDWDEVFRCEGVPGERSENVGSISEVRDPCVHDSIESKRGEQ